MAYESELAQAETAHGLDNPTLSFNLAGAYDYNPGLQFLDLTKMMRPWIGHVEDGWGGMTTDELRDGGYLDADGWPTEIPAGLERVGTIWAWSDFRENAGNDHAGVYVLEYEGEGTIEVRGDATIISSEPGRIVFENTDAASFIMNIMETDPRNNGNYIKNISIVAEEHKDLYDAGAVFNPDWLALVEDARDLRFMNWMETNNSEVTSWDEMPSVTGPFGKQGMPVEYMVQLANELGVDPWFTMPHLADDDYIRNFATYVRDNLDPELTARVEYSNEVWNLSFEQARWVRDQSEAEWGESARFDYHVKKAVETALIWEDVYGPEADGGRLANVLGTNAVNPWLSERLLDAAVWRENEPENYVDPTTVFEELATTTYFGVATMGHNDLRDELIAAINNPAVDAKQWLANRLQDPNYTNSIPQIAASLKETAAVAHDNGLKLVSYEGGQHVHHSFAVSGLTEAHITALNDFMIDFVRSEEMAELYQQIWDAWAANGDGAFMQFTDIATPSKWGSWALYDSQDDATPRSELLERLNDRTSPWWTEAEGGEFRQQGVTETGTNANDVMIGTPEEDYLMGGRGNDTFIAGKGNDGINGGRGTDRVVLSGSPADYSLRIEGDGYRINGPDGSDFIINVEELAFGTGEVVILADLKVNSDGVLELTEGTGPINPTDPGSDVIRIKKTEVIDGETLNEVKLGNLGSAGEGVVIKAIDHGSALGTMLSLDGSGGKPSYIFYASNTDNPEDGLDGSSASLDLNNAAITVGAPTITATKEDDILRGSGMEDRVSGAGGDDALYGRGGDDYLRGKAGDDRLYGMNNDDVLHGNKGQDKIFAGKGDDTVNGGSGADTLKGGRGDDKLSGQAGNDIMTGGSGKDEFVFSAGTGQDIVTDFSVKDTLTLKDFLSDGQSIDDAASMADGNLVLSNGDDSITLLGLGMDDFDWVKDSIA